MVNASLNWASIVGIVLAVGGAMLYFMRSFKPALARDYDVFFAAIGLLCGGILFFQGWRLDPILQFGQFLLAGTTVFFAYESVRLRGISAEQARRSAYFDDEPPARGQAPGMRGGYDDSYESFDEPQPLRRRFAGQEFDRNEGQEDDLYRPRRSSRAAIPEQAASRRRGRPEEPSSWRQDSEQDRRMARFGNRDDDRPASGPSFGDRRNQREDQRRGSRPSAASSRTGSPSMTSPRPTDDSPEAVSRSPFINRSAAATPPGVPQGTPFRQAAEDAAYSPSKRQPGQESPPNTRSQDSGRTPPRSSRPRDNSSRFDD
ncbi:Ycf66 family protein [Synechococcus sp. UW179A]|uniref:Ycf66 family protein n=1 Tax=Synechococcus sp. UW179A TaxID=2575510 RepID=UPI000E0F5E0E|nr:Ycf66 family protein [Synechococcus sp. UW179A]